MRSPGDPAQASAPTPRQRGPDPSIPPARSRSGAGQSHSTLPHPEALAGAGQPHPPNPPAPHAGQGGLRAAETGSLNPSLLSGEGSPGASRAGEESRCARPPGLECVRPAQRGLWPAIAHAACYSHGCNASAEGRCAQRNGAPRTFRAQGGRDLAVSSKPAVSRMAEVCGIAARHRAAGEARSAGRRPSPGRPQPAAHPLRLCQA
jgi:hypothetical protein